MALLHILVFFLLLGTTDTRKKKCNERIVKLFQKTRRGVEMQSLIFEGAWEIQQWKYKSVLREFNL